MLITDSYRTENYHVVADLFVVEGVAITEMHITRSISL